MQCFQFWFLCKMPNCTYYSTWTTANSGFEIAFYSSELSNKVFTNFSLFDGNPKRQDFFIPKFLKFPMRFTSEYIWIRNSKCAFSTKLYRKFFHLQYTLIWIRNGVNVFSDHLSSLGHHQKIGWNCRAGEICSTKT